ncbi:hypothetical protein O0I10_011709 [Lichtheimia ornata]|uniref:SWIM-type domain-containing protein n=1 Tax=Lichtheimia ornata TaxID=688661 RepID=A0AAD7UUR6_9FUNG|nr:uncharacterized protein O0I10_011709 [Lichtheimia ornata]KAJ8652631.1 hypothetical protein O0I10_011709 [Lichtheimia ornata]
MYDIIWLQGHPAIAAIHYYQHLKDTHVFYCPDDGNHPMPIRALARDILTVYDSNNKSLAVHFMHPCGDKRLDQVMLFINKIRAELRMACYELPTSKLQINLLLGWSMSIYHQHNTTAEQWMRRCLVPYDPAASQAPSSCTIHCVTDDANKLFCISDTPFIKQALFVNITLSLCDQAPSIEHGIVLTTDAKAAIQGWSDAMASLSIAGTLIFFVDEKLLFRQVVVNETSKSKQEGLLTRLRKATYERLQEMNAACPIYMYSRDYCDAHHEELIDQITCMQHRHHLDLSRSLCLHFSRQEARKVEDHPYLSSIQNVYLNEEKSKNRSRWEGDFSTMIQADKASSEGDTLSLKSPSLLDLPPEITSDSLVPLVKHLKNEELTTTEHFEERLTHSVSASNASTYEKWKLCMEAAIPVGDPIQSDTIMKEAIHNGDKDTTTSPLSPPKEPEQHEGIQEPYHGDPVDLMESFSYALKDDMIVKYIDNQGAYKRGGSILDSLDQTEFSGNEEKITLFTKAKGTAAEPYNVHITLEKPSGGNIVISGGVCSCPVGKGGKCKHCVATLKMFMINGDDFDYAPTRKPPPSTTTNDTNPPSKAKAAISKDTAVSEKQPNVTTATLAPAPQPPQPSSTSITTQPSSSSSTSRPPRRRRSLPWSDALDEQPKAKTRRKVNTEDDDKKKPKKATTTTKARQKKKMDEDESTSASTSTAPKRATTTRGKKKTTVDAMDDEFGVDMSIDVPKRATTTRRKKKTTVDAMDDEFGADTSSIVDTPKPKTTTTRRKKKATVDVMDDEFGIDTLSSMDMPTTTTRRKTPSRRAKVDKQQDVAMSTSDTSEKEDDDVEPKKSVVDLMDSEFGLGMPAMEKTPTRERSLSPQISSSLEPPPSRSSTPIIMFKKSPLKNDQVDDDDDSDATQDGLDLMMNDDDEDISSPFQNHGSKSYNMSLDIPITTTRSNSSSDMSLDIPATTTTTTTTRHSSNKPSDKEKDTIMIHSSDDDERDKVDDLFDEIGL